MKRFIDLGQLHNVCVEIIDDFGCCSFMCSDFSLCSSCPNSTSPSNLECINIDATKPGMENLDAWVNNGIVSTVDLGFGLSEIRDLHFNVTGNLEIGNNHTFRGCHFTFSDPNSSLIGLNQLFLNNCTLEACHNSWEGIILNEGMRFSITDSNINDARVAIQIHGNQTNFIISQCNFENNSVAIGTVHNDNNFYIVSNAILEGNTFISTNAIDQAMLLERCELHQMDALTRSTMTGYTNNAISGAHSNLTLSAYDILGANNSTSVGISMSNVNLTLSDINVSGHGKSCLVIDQSISSDIKISEFECLGCSDLSTGSIAISDSQGINFAATDLLVSGCIMAHI